LGLKDIRKFNHALLAKWIWRCISQEEGRWKEILVSKYGLEIESAQTSIKLQSWRWRDLNKLCKEGGGKGWFQEELSWELGCGDKVKFWEEVWVGSTDLKSLFPRLYSMSLNKGQTVGEVGVWVNSKWRWNLGWRCTRFEWESAMEADLLMLLTGAIMKKNVKDVQVWGKVVIFCELCL